MAKEKKEKHFIKKPVYPGGPRALKAFVGQNLKYPTKALAHQVEGTVVIQYEIDYQGQVVNAKVVSGLGYGCDEEATRLVQLLQFEVPKTRGVKVLFHKDIQIHFRLPKKKPQAIQYAYIEQKKEPATADSPTPEKGNSYTYTITFPG